MRSLTLAIDRATGIGARPPERWWLLFFAFAVLIAALSLWVAAARYRSRESW
jgi:hypothetical protein